MSVLSETTCMIMDWKRTYFITKDSVKLAVPVLPVALLHEQQSFCNWSWWSLLVPHWGRKWVIGGSTGIIDLDWLHRRPLRKCLGLVTAPPYKSEPSMNDVGFCSDLGSQVDNLAKLPLLKVNGDLSWKPKFP